MNWRMIITDALIMFMVLFFFVFFMPYQVNKYLERCTPEPIQLSEDTIRRMKQEQWELEAANASDDIDWDIDEVINISDYIDDIDVWQHQE